MWLVGVVRRRYIDILIIIINFPYSTCIRSFFGSSILTSLFIFKMFFRSFIYIERERLFGLVCSNCEHSELSNAGSILMMYVRTYVHVRHA